MVWSGRQEAGWARGRSTIRGFPLHAVAVIPSASTDFIHRKSGSRPTTHRASRE